MCHELGRSAINSSAMTGVETAKVSCVTLCHQWQVQWTTEYFVFNQGRNMFSKYGLYYFLNEAVSSCIHIWNCAYQLL